MEIVASEARKRPLESPTRADSVSCALFAVSQGGIGSLTTYLRHSLHKSGALASTGASELWQQPKTDVRPWRAWRVLLHRLIHQLIPSLHFIVCQVDPASEGSKSWVPKGRALRPHASFPLPSRASPRLLPSYLSSLTHRFAKCSGSLSH